MHSFAIIRFARLGATEFTGFPGIRKRPASAGRLHSKARWARRALRALDARVLNPGEDIDVPVVGLDDLIQMKLARSRPVDLADVAALTDPDAEGDS
jgi:hypothetical protein